MRRIRQWLKQLIEKRNKKLVEQKLSIDIGEERFIAFSKYIDKINSVKSLLRFLYFLNIPHTDEYEMEDIHELVYKLRRKL